MTSVQYSFVMFYVQGGSSIDNFCVSDGIAAKLHAVLQTVENY